MKDIGAHVGFTVLWGKVSKVVRAGVQMCYYYPAAPPFHVMTMLSGNRVVWILSMVMDAPCCEVACGCVGVAAECARERLTAPCSASSKRLLILIMPKRRDYARSVSASSNDLNMR
jgi:hypothetical protein